LALALAVSADTWRALPSVVTSVGTVASQLGYALLLASVAFAGSGGGQNLCQSNWIRDKGFGMGQYVPRLVSPLTGEEQASASVISSYHLDADAADHAPWR